MQHSQPSTAKRRSVARQDSDVQPMNTKETNNPDNKETACEHSSTSSDRALIFGCDNDEPSSKISPRRAFAASSRQSRGRSHTPRGRQRLDHLMVSAMQEKEYFGRQTLVDDSRAPLPPPASLALQLSPAPLPPQTPRDLELSKLRAQLEVAQAQKKALVAKTQQQIANPPTPILQHVSTQTEQALPGLQNGTGARAPVKESPYPPPHYSLCAVPERTMAPPRQKALLKEKFVPYFSKLKTSTYSDTPVSRPVPSAHVIRTLAWNALGTLIATGAPDRTLRIWNPERTNVKYSTELRSHASPVEWVEFNPSNESELASVTADGTVRIWDVRKKDCVAEIKLYGKDNYMGKDGFVDLLAWRPDGGELLVGTTAKSPSSAPPPHIPHPRATLTPTTTLTPSAPISSFSFSHSTAAPSLLTTSPTGTLSLTDFPSLTPLHTLHPHSSPITSHALSPPSTLLATGGSDALITLWDTTDWVCVRTLDRSVGPVTSVSFSFDGSYVAGGCEEGSPLEVAHAESGEYVWRAETGGGCVRWHPARYVLACAGEYGLRIVGGVGG